MVAKSNTIFYATYCCIVLLLLFFISMETSEGARFLEQKEEGVWRENIAQYLLLPSLQWRSVRSPGSNPGTNSLTDATSQISERNFAGSKKVAHPPPLPFSNNKYISTVDTKNCW
ncbi:hypothetical protein EJD97_006012 [Solanum chilense]|uniref:Uncharacterized protein n=1 Tax=Solanum chilense TaxID=4083 RepID=A0A6N2AMN4_SOLCI|nr:hypothetical protein EJD97_006012 [Solanum chilense]